MSVQAGLGQALSETPNTGFLVSQLICFPAVGASMTQCCVLEHYGPTNNGTVVPSDMTENLLIGLSKP